MRPTSPTSRFSPDERAALDAFAAAIETRIRREVSDDSDQPAILDASDRPLLIALARRTSTARLDRGWTSQMLASQAGVPISTIRRIEDGMLRPSHEVARRLADALGVDVNRLLAPADSPVNT